MFTVIVMCDRSIYRAFLLTCPRARHLYRTESVHPPGDSGTAAVRRAAMKETHYNDEFKQIPRNGIICCSDETRFCCSESSNMAAVRKYSCVQFNGVN
jgi:hypothetical protein